MTRDPRPTTSNVTTDFALTFGRPVAAAHIADINENLLASLAHSGSTVKGRCEPYGIQTVVVEME